MTTTELEGTAGYGRKSLAKINDDVKFFPHQLSGVRTLATRTSFLLADEMGGGKAQPLDALVATPSGWRPIGALKPGDEICRPSGGTQSVLLTHPQGVKDIACVTLTDGSYTHCTWDHLWAVACEDEWIILTTRELHAAGLEDDEGRPRWLLPIARPLESHGAPGLTGDADVLTAGFLFAGGFHFSQRDADYRRLRVSVGRDPNGLSALHVENTHLDEDWDSEHDRPVHYLVPEDGHPNALHDWLGHMATDGIHRRAGKRYIPTQIMNGTSDTRLKFLVGMILASAEVRPSSGSNLTLALGPHYPNQTLRDVLSLIRSQGWCAEQLKPGHIALRIPSTAGLPNGLSITTPPPMRAIATIHPAGQQQCVCITVDDEEGLYVLSLIHI